MAVNRERKIVNKQSSDYIELDYMNLSYIKKQIDTLIEKYGDSVVVKGVEDPYSDSDRQTFYVYVERPETDAEMKVRIAQEEKWQAEQNERDLKRYEELKKKFG